MLGLGGGGGGIHIMHGRRRLTIDPRLGWEGVGRERVGCWGSRRAVLFLAQAGVRGVSYMR